MAIHGTKITQRLQFAGATGLGLPANSNQINGTTSNGFIGKYSDPSGHQQARSDMILVAQDWPLLQLAVQQNSDGTFSIFIMNDFSPSAPLALSTVLPANSDQANGSTKGVLSALAHWKQMINTERVHPIASEGVGATGVVPGPGPVPGAGSVQGAGTGAGAGVAGDGAGVVNPSSTSDLNFNDYPATKITGYGQLVSWYLQNATQTGVSNARGRMIDSFIFGDFVDVLGASGA
jgi:hypothetical protein